MRLYGGRLFRNQVRRQLNERRELRDAIVMDVDQTNHYCRVKIQGSNIFIKAWFPENWESTPQFLKPGNCVRISHPGGVKGRIEVVGHGMLLPTAVPGGTVTPAPATPPDAVLSGCTLSPADPASMAALVTAGTYRIEEIVYSLSGIEMDDSTLEMDRNDLEFGSAGATVIFDAASSTLFRYDLVVVGTDGTPYIVKGAESAADPVMPTIPADKVSLGWVLVYPNMATITSADINRYYSVPVASELRAVPTTATLDWPDEAPIGEGDEYTDIEVSVRDQYGNYRPGVGAGFAVTVSFSRGNGEASYDGDTGDEASPLSFYYTGNSAIVRYTRDGELTDSSPILSVVETGTGLDTIFMISLLSVSGEIMY